MSSICIVTDSSAQLTNSSFLENGIINVISLNPEIKKHSSISRLELNASNLPKSICKELNPYLHPPSLDDFRQLFSQLGKNFNEIIGIFLSSNLNPCYNIAVEAASSLQCGAIFQMIDSQTISIGLGFLIQATAEAIYNGASATEAERYARSIIPKIYSIICTPDLSHLNYNGLLDFAQAIIGEYLGLIPIFSLEEGKLSPIEKTRNERHALLFLEEFLDEFEELQHIAIFKSPLSNCQKFRMLCEHAREKFPKTTTSEHNITLPVATLFGPQIFGLTVLEPFF